MTPLIEYEAAIRLGAFVAVFLVMALLEIVLEERPLTLRRRTRWTRHGALLVVNTLLVRLLFPAGAAGAAVFAERHELGILRALPLPPWAAAVAAFLLLDFLLWLQHVLFHAVPRLFALHQVHHADRDFDATLGVRFHPLEMLLSMALKAGMVLLIGAPVFVVVLFELVLNATSVFNHANVRFPRAVDRLLRLFVVTPAMHRIHHSEAGQEMNANFGFNLPWWDRLFGTYRAAAAAPIVIGMHEHQDIGRQTLSWMLLLPFRSGSKLHVRFGGLMRNRPVAGIGAFLLFVFASTGVLAADTAPPSEPLWRFDTQG